MGSKTDILIIGAGAAGLIAGRELARAGKKIIILEARNRIGGRIFPLNESNFGYPAQGGAEFVHGEAPITRDLIKKAGLKIIPEDGEIWSARGGELSHHESFIRNNDSLKTKLNDLKEDVSIANFLYENFGNKPEDVEFKNSVIKMVEGYDAADPNLISTFTLREEWLGKVSDWEDGRIDGGYGLLLNFLESECRKYGVEIHLGVKVKEVNFTGDSVSIQTEREDIFHSSKVIVTVALPTLKDITFTPNIEKKLNIASKIGFGNAVKIVIKFKTRWWEDVQGKDMTKMGYLLCNEKFLTWWSQYPIINTALVGWMSGPEAMKYKDAKPDELLIIALTSLANVFKIKLNILEKEVDIFEVVNWQADPFSKGAYSYTTFYTKDAYEKLAVPIDNKIFFAGEAVYSGLATATVEGALGSGIETAQKILKL